MNFLLALAIFLVLLISHDIFSVRGEAWFVEADEPPVNNLMIRPRIVGGQITTTSYPFHVHAMHTTLCGGTLIHDDIVLTAAHCRDAYRPTGIAYLGGLSVFGNDAVERIPIALVRAHPEYVPGLELNDIMLVKLASASAMTPITLNRDPSSPQPQSYVVAMGYGATVENGAASDRLREVSIVVTPFEECQRSFTSINGTIQLCAGYPQGGRDTCNGDSGGPLLDSTGRVQVGIVSFGRGCGRPNSPGVYTRVSFYTDWIREFICLYSDKPPRRGCEDLVASANDPADTLSPPLLGWPPKKVVSPIPPRMKVNCLVMTLIVDEVH